MQIEREDLARAFPRALPAWLDAMARLAPQLADFYDFTRLDWTHFVGQIGAETDGLSLADMRENMRFTTARRVLEVYSYRLGVALERDAELRAQYRTRAALAAALVGKPDFLADVVYGGREGTPWMQGSRYIGRGPTQITHLDNYRAIGAEIRCQPGGQSVDLEYNPDALATDPDLGVRSAFADWHLKGLSRWARADDVDAVSAVLNTGSAHKVALVNGLDRRKRWTAKAKAIWPAATDTPENAQSEPVAAVSPLVEGSTGPDVEALQRLLRERGYAVGAVDGVYGPLVARAVVAFQHEHGLPVDGNVDAHDLDVLRQTAPAALPGRATADTVPGSQQIAAGRAVQRTTATTGGLLGAEAVGQTLGASPFELVVHEVGHVQELLSMTGGLGLKIPPIAVACLVAVVLLPPAWAWGRRMVAARLAAHRAGLNLSR